MDGSLVYYIRRGDHIKIGRTKRFRERPADDPTTEE